MGEMTEPPRLTPEREAEIRDALDGIDPRDLDSSDACIAELLAELSALRETVRTLEQERDAYKRANTVATTVRDRAMENRQQAEADLAALRQEREALQSAVKVTCEAHQIALEREDQAKAELSSLRQAHARLQEELPLTFERFSQANLRRSVDPAGFNHAIESWDLSDWMIAVFGELGEAANIVKKLNRERDGVRGNTETEAALRTKLAGELADTFIYLDLIFQSLGLSLVLEVTRTWDAKSQQIGYPLRLALDPSRPTPKDERP